MKSARSFLHRHSLIAGLVLMFAFTWPIDLANAGVVPIQVPFAVYITLGWGFIYAALIMTWLTQGRKAVVALLKRYLIWRVRWTWYVVALLLYPLIFGAAVALNAAWAQEPADFGVVMAHRFFGPAANLAQYVLPFFLFDAITNGEEMGWRGYVLPRLQARHSALVASLILGVIWGFWHLPKFVDSDSASSFALFMVKILADAVLYTWLYNNTRGSLLLVTMFHAAGNTAGVFLPVATTASSANTAALIIAVVLEIIVAVVVVAISGPGQLSRRAPKQVQI